MKYKYMMNPNVFLLVDNIDKNNYLKRKLYKIKFNKIVEKKSSEIFKAVDLHMM